jgi:hypothetical protein
MTSRNLRLAASLLALMLAACSGAAGPSASPSPVAITVTSPEQAAARVVEVAPSLAGIGPRNPDLIGGCCFWEATPSADGYEVMFEVGWGDCPSGCIERHRWTYAVSHAGAVELVKEQGAPVPSGVPGSGTGSTGNTGGGGGIIPGGSGIEGRVLAGPTCPVVTVNDPSCDDRPIAGATILVLDAGGREVARLGSDASGRYAVTLPPGPYTIEPQPVEGFFRKAEPVAVTVGDGFVTVDINFDTGIR